MKKLSLDALNRDSLDTYRSANKNSIVLLLDNVRSGHNVGSTFRTGDAFKVEKIVLGGITQKPPHREILKTAIGATQSVKWEYFENVMDAVNALKAKGYKIILVEQTTDSISLQNWSINLEENIVLVFGNEVNGVTESILELADMALEIPQFGTKHSLNISVAVGIVLWEYIRNLQ